MKELLKKVIREQIVACLPGGSCQTIGPQQDYGFGAGGGDYEAEDYWMLDLDDYGEDGEEGGDEGE